MAQKQRKAPMFEKNIYILWKARTTREMAKYLSLLKAILYRLPPKNNSQRKGKQLCVPASLRKKGGSSFYTLHEQQIIWGQGKLISLHHPFIPVTPRTRSCHWQALSDTEGIGD